MSETKTGTVKWFNNQKGSYQVETSDRGPVATNVTV